MGRDGQPTGYPALELVTEASPSFFVERFTSVLEFTAGHGIYNDGFNQGESKTLRAERDAVIRFQ